MERLADGKLRSMRGRVEEARRLVSEKNFMEADKFAREVLRMQFGDEDMDNTVWTEDAKDTAARVPEDRRPHVGAAMTVLGVSYANRRQHVTAVNYLDAASEMMPDDIYTLRNLSDLTAQAQTHTISKETDEWGKEMNRQTLLGMEKTDMLLGLLGVTEGMVTGKEDIDPLTANDDTIRNSTWALNNMGQLLYRRGRFFIHNMNDKTEGNKVLNAAVNVSKTTLSVLGMQRDIWDDDGAKEVVPHLGKMRTTVSKALTIMGMSHRMMGHSVEAYRSFRLALDISPEMKITQDNLDRVVSDHPQAREKAEDKVLQAKDTQAAELARKAEKEAAEKARQVEEAASKKAVGVWDAKRTGSYASPDPQAPKLSFDAVNNGSYRAEAGILAKDLYILISEPAEAPTYINAAKQWQDGFWAGIDGDNLPALARVERTLKHINQDAQRYGMEASQSARATLETYDNIRDTMMTDDMGQDYKKIHTAYRDIARRQS